MTYSKFLYLLDVVLAKVDDELHDVLHEGFRAGILGRFRFKDVGNLLSEWLKNNLKGNLEGILEGNLVFLPHGVDDMVVVLVRLRYAFQSRTTPRINTTFHE